MGFPALRAQPAAPSAAAPQVFQQSFTPTLSFTGAFVASRFFLRSFSATLFPGGGAFNPSTISGLKLWLKADSLALSDGDPVTAWNDSSANGYNLTGTATYKTSIINGKPIVRFNGTSHGMSGSGNLVGEPDTIIIVSSASVPGTESAFIHTDGQILSVFTNSKFYLYALGAVVMDAATIDSAFHVFTGTFSPSGNAIGYIDGTLRMGPAAAGTSGILQLYLLSDSVGGHYPGDVAEMLIYDSALSSTDRGNVENYLGSKYGISVPSSSSAIAATLTRKPLKNLTATFSSVAALSRGLAKALLATLASTAALTKKYLDAGFTATLSFIGNLAVSKTFLRALTATLSFSGALSRRTGKALGATLSFIGALTKNIPRNYSATLSFSAALSRRIGKALNAALSFIGSLAVSKLFVRIFTATLNFTGVFSRRTGKALSAALSFIGNLATSFIAGGGHLFLQSYAATASFVGAFTKLPQKNFAATLSFIVALAKSIRDAGFAATLSLTGFLSVSKSFLKAFTATLSFTGVLSRRAGKGFSATLSVAASLVRRSARVFSATLSSAGALVKAIRDAGFSATLSFAGALTTAAVHFFTRSFAAALSFAGTILSSRRFARLLTATLNMTGAVRRQIGKSLAARLSFSGAIRRAIRKVFSAVLSFVGFLFKGGAVEILAGMVTKAGALIGLAGSTARISKAGSQLDVREAESGAEIPICGSQLRVERTK